MIYKCKMCGGSLDIKGNESVCTCEYCGTKQTLPKLDDEKKANLYDRANHLRMNNDFDKAASIYEQILSEDNSDAETYWSLVLCEYGIEYVEDPSSHKRIPTVNRAQFTSIFQDDNYKQAIKLADNLQKDVYEHEAKEIDDIQKGILAISNKEEPFDIFICYKETDNQGRRTQDSVLANDLYNELTRDGYKVFFSRITLEDKLGTAYEPYIFAALNSAKAMIVIGTKPEYFNAVWVKNEWSRYLSLIKKDHSKVLIPAYKDMDPYDLPEEFSHLQAQDMSKLGFMQDLTRGIKKIIGESSQNISKNVSSTNLDALIKRAYIFLEDGQFDKANDYSEKILDSNPENADAYLIKLLVQLKLNKPSDLSTYLGDLSNNDLYIRTIRYSNDKLKNELSNYLEEANKLKENNEKDSKYNEALKLLEVRRLDKQNDAISILESLDGWKDSNELIIKCKSTIEEINRESDIKRLAKEERNLKIKKAIPFIAASIIVCIAMFFLITKVILPSVKYNKAISLLENKEYSSAQETFVELGDYKDSFDKFDESTYLLAKEQEESGDYASAYNSYSKIIEYSDAKNLCSTVALKYIDELMNEGDNEEALSVYNDATYLLIDNNFWQSNADLKKTIYYNLAVQKYNEKKYKESVDYFRLSGTKISDNQNYINSIWEFSEVLISEKNYLEAIEILELIPSGSTIEDNINYETLTLRLLGAKYGYILSVKDTDDYKNRNSTYYKACEFGEDLINADYPIDNELFGWNVEIVSNDSEDDSITDLSSLSKYSNWYFHVTLNGGMPGEEIILHYKGFYPDGDTSSGTWDWSWNDGDNSWACFWYNNPAYGRTGTFKIVIYDDDWNVLGEKRITITG